MQTLEALRRAGATSNVKNKHAHFDGDEVVKASRAVEASHCDVHAVTRDSRVGSVKSDHSTLTLALVL